MNLTDDGIRKAAILVDSLDRAVADSMLEQLGPEQAQRVRDTMVELGSISSRERQGVIEEFFRAGPRRVVRDDSGVELDGSLARSLAAARPDGPSDRPSRSHSAHGRPFGFLEETEVANLARVLAAERPQTIALVLSHLPPEQAGAVLIRLEPPHQVDVIHRLVDLEETDPEILAEVERALQSRLSQQIHMQRRRVAGLKAVTGILDASGGQVAEQILGSLAAHDRPLAERLSPPELRFDDLGRLDDAALHAVFRAAEPELAMTALIGARPELIDRVLRQSAAPEAKRVRHELEHPGPIRLSDVEGARRQIVELVRHLDRQGQIQLPVEFSLAAA